MSTAQDLIISALRKLHAYNRDSVLDASESNDALETLNDMLDSWSNESLTINQVTRETFTLTNGLNPHTIGTGGDLNTTAPLEILSASIQISSGLDIPLSIISYDQYELIRLKTITNSYPDRLYFDNAHPLGNIYLYPVPTGYDINLDTLKPLTTPAVLTTTIDLPPGYKRAIVYNLAVELAPEYPEAPGMAAITAVAIRSLAAIKRTNKKGAKLQLDPALMNEGQSRPNIYRGY